MWRDVLSNASQLLCFCNFVTRQILVLLINIRFSDICVKSSKESFETLSLKNNRKFLIFSESKATILSCRIDLSLHLYVGLDNTRKIQKHW